MTEPKIHISRAIWDEDTHEVAYIVDGLMFADVATQRKLNAVDDMYEALEHLRIVAQKVCDDFCCGAGCYSDATDCHLEAGLIHAEIALRKARGETE